MADEASTFKVEDAQIIFRNFEGKETQYNRKGDRNFSVVLPPDVAIQMLEDGWNVKFSEPREDGDEGTYHIQVAVSYKNRPPRVVLITSGGRTQLNEDAIEVLDFADIQTADLIARGYNWVVGDKSGTKAYLQTLFVTIREDDLERKYKIHEDPPS